MSAGQVSMVAGSSTPHVSRDRAFHNFHKRTGLKPFGPDFHNALVNVMRSRASLQERYFAWVRWRAWCNSSEFAVSDWNNGYPLDQTDAALDLWWFRQGKAVEWVEGAPKEFRDKERQRKEVQNFKPNLSVAAAVVESRGSTRSEGGKIFPVISPAVVGSNNRTDDAVIGSNNRYLTDKRFHAWRAVARSNNHEAFLVARSAWNEARRVARSDYREYLEQANSDAVNLIDVIMSGNSKQASTEPQPEPKACLPATSDAEQTPEASVPSAPKPEGEPEAGPLAALADLFSSEYVGPKALSSLDQYLVLQLGPDYSRQRYIEFVRVRSEGKKIRAGLALDRTEHGLPHDFIKREKERLASERALEEQDRAYMEASQRQLEMEEREWREREARADAVIQAMDPNEYDGLVRTELRTNERLKGLLCGTARSEAEMIVRKRLAAERARDILSEKDTRA